MSLTKDSEYLWQLLKFCHFPADPKICTNYGPGWCGQNAMDTFVSTLARKCGLEAEKYKSLFKGDRY